MGRILAIDYGLKRTGLAVSDPLKMIAAPLETIESARIFTFLTAYFIREPVELILIGDPRNLDDSPTHITDDVRRIIGLLQKKFPQIPVLPVDEQFSSARATRALLEMGMKKSKRRQKEMTDQVAAALMLQEYLEMNSGGTDRKSPI